MSLLQTHTLYIAQAAKLQRSKMPRAEFSKSTRLQAFSRCGGNCEQCLQKLITPPDYHHIIEAAIGGSNDLENCKVLCRKCHRVITSTESIPQVSRSTRIFEKRAGVRTKRPFGKRADPWGKGRDA
jgi:5-methylcytosine-specific restriction endonuclease McrA